MASESRKPVHSLIVDTGPLIKNTVSISTMLSQAEEIYTTPAILSEIRDTATRSRIATSLMPFLKVRSPSSKSYERIVEFSKKTGDFSVLSRQDLGILALAYEVECEREGGDWRLRNMPGENLETRQPVKEGHREADKEDASQKDGNQEHEISDALTDTGSCINQSTLESKTTPPEKPIGDNPETLESSHTTIALEVAVSNMQVSAAEPQLEMNPSDDDDDGGWITLSNLARHQAKDASISTKETAPTQMSVATMTTDFAMQNVLLQMNLHLLSPSLQRIRILRTFVLRCHACFLVTKDMSKQFCPRCGQPTLNRISCTTNANGEFKLHLSKNHQWNNRGNKYSVPKPVAGAASGKHAGKGGGKGGWGRDLVLTEDQKEYARAVGQEKRSKARDLMDEDYLPGILTGDRGRAGGRPKIGAGRNINSRKRF
ncbi:hypothetical protein CC78DRAFT_539922 [Lojkania enalia]|uniref:20S-pre-rRNA D-site endonuclease NOB1 n=1 Tax=Lojkania enalia TaxID=147567 RepID=A0A9P4NA03_9PLEO|nr:hypothetical protein CC78DRAFT_539922 [Didymosphaeria enalia]